MPSYKRSTQGSYEIMPGFHTHNTGSFEGVGVGCLKPGICWASLNCMRGKSRYRKALPLLLRLFTTLSPRINGN